MTAPSSASFRVALLGLGIMGHGMGQNLLKKGFALTVYNRTRSKADPLAAAGAQVANTAREASADADVVISMVGDDTASRAMWTGADGALASVRPSAVLVECSTLSVEWMKELTGLASAKHIALLDSPVGGSKGAAEAGALKLFIGGEAEVIARIRPVLEAFSADIVHMGPSGAGTMMKLLNNMMASVHTVALAEGMVLAERAGLDMTAFLNQITNGAVASPIVKGKAARMAEHRYTDTEFALRWMCKDATYALEAANEYEAALPMVAAAREIYRIALNQGLHDADFAAVIEALRPKQV